MMLKTILALSALAMSSGALAQEKYDEASTKACVKAAALDIAAKTQEGADVIVKVAMNKCPDHFAYLDKMYETVEYATGRSATAAKLKLRREAEAETLEAVIDARMK